MSFAVSSSESATENKLYDRSFLLAFFSQVLFVPANAALVHYAEWVQFLYHGDQEKALLELGYITSFGAILGFVSRPWLGQLINRFGSRLIWIIGYLLFITGFMGNLWISEVNWGIYALRGIMFLGVGCIFTSSITYITLTTPEQRRTEAIGILGVGGFIGFLIGPMIGEIVLGGAPGEAEFNQYFWMGSVCVLISMSLLFFMPSPPGNVKAGSLSLVQFIKTCQKYWPGSIVFINMAFGLSMTVPLHLLKKFVLDENLNEAMVGELGIITVFYMVYAGWGMTIRILLKKAPDRIGRRKVLCVGLTSMVLGFCGYCTVSASSMWMILLPAFLCGTGHGLTYHCMTALSLQTFPTENRGTGTALSLMAFDFGAVVGMPIMARLVVWQGYNTMFLTVAATVAVISIIYFKQNGIR
ncbi:MAG: MFS transporter [Pirellulales bacterium]|nr:MFS transporter [Pirellulales bacterium]